MGNSLSNAPESPYDKSLLNQLRQKGIEDLSECFIVLSEDYADCTAIDYSQFEDVFGIMVDDAEPFFLVLQNDHDLDGQVDIYETLAAFAIFTKDKFEKKAAFVFSIFDFDKNKNLELAELIITLQSAARGLCKFVNIIPPSLHSLELDAKNIFAMIDHDNNKRISFDEFMLWIKHNADLQDFLLKYAGIQTYENMKRRYDSIFSVFLHLFIMACGTPIAEYSEEETLRELIETEAKAHLNPADLDFLFKVLTDTSVFLSDGVLDPSEKKISRKAYESVMKAWSAFSASDIGNDNSLAASELRSMIWIYEDEEPSDIRVQNDLLEIDKDRTGLINRYEWINSLCSVDKNGKTVFRNNLKKLFEKYDKDNSGFLSIDELEELVKEAFRGYSKKGIDETKHHLIENMIESLGKEIFNELDSDKTRSIGWEEFKNYMEISMGKIQKLKDFLDKNL